MIKKSILLCLSLISTLLICSCEAPVVSFPVDIETEFTIEGGGSGGGLLDPLLGSEFLPENFSPNFSQQLNEQLDTKDLKNDALTSLVLDNLKVEVLSTDKGQSLDFIEEYVLSIDAEKGDLTKLAFTEDGDFKDNPVIYEFQTSKSNFADHIKNNETVNFISDVSVDKRPEEDTDLKITAHFIVEAKLY